MVESRLSYPKKFVDLRHDGSTWERYELSKGFLVVTGEGKKLVSNHRKVLFPLLNRYSRAAEERISDDGVRNYYKSGANSDVYKLDGLDIVIKEARRTQSVWSSLDRLDYLYRICKDHMPEHVRVPAHYFALVTSNLDRDYLVMQMANDGLTISEYSESPDMKPEILEAARAQMSFIQRSVTDISQTLYQGWNFLPDFHEGNIIIDFDNPTEQHPFTLWIIDQ